MQLESGMYWRGLAHGLLLTLPLVAFLYRKWTQSAAAAFAAGAASGGAEEDGGKPKMLGTFLNELFTYEVVLVAGAEMKAVKDQLEAAEQEGNVKRIEALKGRLLDVARVLEQKLQIMMPIIHFLTEQSVNCISQQQQEAATVTEDEPKKDK